MGLAEIPHDPRWIHLVPRPHSLPYGGRRQGLPDDRRALGLPTAWPGSRPIEWFRFALPPGAVALRLPIHGHAIVYCDGEKLLASHDVHRLEAPTVAGAWCTVRVEPRSGPSGGALWSGPAEVVEIQPGSIRLGNWRHQGLEDHSGIVRYATRVSAQPDATVLDLGHVRGTAEVRINDRPAGVRIWSPYRFDIRNLLDRDENVVEIDVTNTLAPQFAVVSTTPWVLPGQKRSGLWGPVTLE